MHSQRSVKVELSLLAFQLREEGLDIHRVRFPGLVRSASCSLWSAHGPPGSPWENVAVARDRLVSSDPATWTRVEDTKVSARGLFRRLEQQREFAK